MTNYNSRLLTQYPPYYKDIQSVKILCKLLLKRILMFVRRKVEDDIDLSKAFVFQSRLGSHLIDDHLMT